jgi:hypothetical protein
MFSWLLLTLTYAAEISSLNKPQRLGIQFIARICTTQKEKRKRKHYKTNWTNEYKNKQNVYWTIDRQIFILKFDYGNHTIMKHQTKRITLDKMCSVYMYTYVHIWTWVRNVFSYLCFSVLSDGKKLLLDCLKYSLLSVKCCAIWHIFFQIIINWLSINTWETVE